MAQDPYCLPFMPKQHSEMCFSSFTRHTEVDSAPYFGLGDQYEYGAMTPAINPYAPLTMTKLGEPALPEDLPDLFDFSDLLDSDSSPVSRQIDSTDY